MKEKLAGQFDGAVGDAVWILMNGDCAAEVFVVTINGDLIGYEFRLPDGYVNGFGFAHRDHLWNERKDALNVMLARATTHAENRKAFADAVVNVWANRLLDGKPEVK